MSSLTPVFPKCPQGARSTLSPEAPSIVADGSQSRLGQKNRAVNSVLRFLVKSRVLFTGYTRAVYNIAVRDKLLVALECTIIIM